MILNNKLIIQHKTERYRTMEEVNELLRPHSLEFVDVSEEEDPFLTFELNDLDVNDINKSEINNLIEKHHERVYQLKQLKQAIG